MGSTRISAYPTDLKEKSEDEEEDSLKEEVDEVHTDAWTVCGEDVFYKPNVVIHVTRTVRVRIHVRV